MYYRHFGLDSAPFRFVPSARELFLSKPHREALAALEWGVLHEPSGFTLLIGEAGTGKTTLIKSILARNYLRVRTACVSNPKRAFEGILREMERQLGLTPQPTRFETLAAFDQFLERLEPGERVVILIDEAQSLDDESLEELRLFSNAGSAEEKQLHFLLVGQPELIRRLRRPELRQLNDRIGARALLQPLSPAEARSYLEFRLKARGSSISRVFEPAAVDYLVAHSSGIPRRINVMGHNAMLLAYSAGTAKVNPKAVRTAAAEYENLMGRMDDHEKNQPAISHWRGAALAAATVAGLLAVIVIETGVAHSLKDNGAYSLENNVTNFAADFVLNPHATALTNFFRSMNVPVEPSLTVSKASDGVPHELRGGASGPNEQPGMSPNATSRAAGDRQAQHRQIRVRHGDTLQRLAIRYLGSQNRLQNLIDANPQLHNFNMIYPGEPVYLPDLASEE